MKPLSIYLDTSVVSFLLADDEPELRDITIEFFDAYLGRYEVAVSEVLLFEIGKTADEGRRARLQKAIQTYRLPVIDLTDDERAEVFALVGRYMEAGVIPPGKREDALHLAIATVRQYDILLSWNFRHLANIHKQTQVNAVNAQAGYRHPLNLLNPMEVMYEE
jgi:predicted nucleic acid-binding protein